jgi:hypothetical protein
MDSPRIGRRTGTFRGPLPRPTPGTSDVSVRAALVCYRSTQTGPVTVEWTYWDSTGQARQAEAELTPCGPQCIGVHSVVRVDLLPEPRRRAGRDRPVTAGSSLGADEVKT